jgi:hypothetical protein
VCRFNLTVAAGSSHFYSGDPVECEAVPARFPAAWIFESANVFYVALPDTATGACPAGTQPVWRFLNATAPNHRYTTDVQIRDSLRSDARWIGEGYGPDQVIMCAPAV